MIYNSLSKEEKINIKKTYKKHSLLAILFVVLSLVSVGLMFILVNRSNIKYLPILFTILFTLFLSCALFINFSFLTIEKEYLKLLKQAEFNSKQVTIGKVINDYKNDSSSFGKIKCFNVKLESEDKEIVFYLEKSDAPILKANTVYKFTTYRHFILQIQEIENET